MTRFVTMSGLTGTGSMSAFNFASISAIHFEDTANWSTWVWERQSSKSLKNSKNRMGPKMEPWGTPHTSCFYVTVLQLVQFSIRLEPVYIVKTMMYDIGFAISCPTSFRPGGRLSIPVDLWRLSFRISRSTNTVDTYPNWKVMSVLLLIKNGDFQTNWRTGKVFSFKLLATDEKKLQKELVLLNHSL